MFHFFFVSLQRKKETSRLKQIVKIVIILLLCGLQGLLFAQVNPYAKIKKVVLIESPNDSLDLATGFWQLSSEEDYDEASSDFFDDEGAMSLDSTELSTKEYLSFNTSTIHYPKVDFSKKQDTTVLVLLSGDQQFVPPCKGHVTSKFGMRRYRYHYGVDLKGRTGDSICSIFDGVVRIARRSPSYGYLVVVRHANGLETYYSHLSKLLVLPEQEVKAGELIGLCGNTGRSFGSHLHFEIRYLGAPLNPEDIIDFDKGELKSPELDLSAYHFRYLVEVNKLKQAVYHKVRNGETLGSIAGRYRTNVSAICRLNGIRSTSIIRVGQRLRVR